LKQTELKDEVLCYAILCLSSRIALFCFGREGGV